MGAFCSEGTDEIQHQTLSFTLRRVALSDAVREVAQGGVIEAQTDRALEGHLKHVAQCNSDGRQKWADEVAHARPLPVRVSRA